MLGLEVYKKLTRGGVKCGANGMAVTSLSAAEERGWPDGAAGGGWSFH